MSATRPWIAPALAFASAAAATAHEVVWARSIGRVVGNTAWSVALTLAVLMLGMGIGSALGTRALVLRPFRRAPYAVAEIGIAISAALVHAVIFSGVVPSTVFVSGGSVALDVGIVSVLALVPALFMGATYPLLLASVLPAAPTSVVTTVYVAGLGGGVVGTLASAGVAVPLFGLDGTAAVACGFGLVVAAVARARLPVLAEGGGEKRGFRARGAGPMWKRRFRARGAGPMFAFAAAGALGLGAQIVWNRALAPHAGVSTFTFAAIVAVYLLGQSAGGAAARRFKLSRVRGAWALALAAGLTPLFLLAAPDLADLVPPRDDASAVAFASGIVLVVIAVVFVPSALLGAAQIAALRDVEASKDGAAGRAGLVAGVGTVAAALAALVTGLVLVPTIGTWRALIALGTLSALVLVAERRWAPLGVAVIGASVAFAVSPDPVHLLGAGLADARVLHFDEDVQDTVAVVELDSGLEPRVRRLVANGVSYSGDSVFAQRYMRLLGHLPALAARGRARAAVICIGTGTTVDAVRRHGFERVDAIDLSPSIEETLALFEDVHGGIERDGSVRIVLADGDRHLRTTDARYDVITLEPPPPRAPGGSTLYTVELYRAARARLADGGAVAQWLPLHGLGGLEARAITAAFLEVFPAASLHLAERNEAILLGRVSDERAPRRELPAAARADLDRFGFRGREPLDDTRIAGTTALRRVSRGTSPVRATWPMPELFPFVADEPREPLAEWLYRAVRAGDPEPESFAAIVGPAAPAFLRVLDGRERRADRERVRTALLALLRRDPADPYAQFMIGYGPLLDERFDRLEVRGLDMRALRERSAGQRTWAEGELARSR